MEAVAQPVRLTLETAGSLRLFLPGELSAAVFALVSGHPRTLAACLLPDRLEWLLADGLHLAQIVGEFRSRSHQLARRHGHPELRWRRCRWSHLARLGLELREAGTGIIEAPRRHGLVRDARDYPFRFLGPNYPGGTGAAVRQPAFPTGNV